MAATIACFGARRKAWRHIYVRDEYLRLTSLEPRPVLAVGAQLARGDRPLCGRLETAPITSRSSCQPWSRSRGRPRSRDPRARADIGGAGHAFAADCRDAYIRVSLGYGVDGRDVLAGADRVLDSHGRRWPSSKGQRPSSPWSVRKQCGRALGPEDLELGVRGRPLTPCDEPGPVATRSASVACWRARFLEKDRLAPGLRNSPFGRFPTRRSRSSSRSWLRTCSRSRRTLAMDGRLACAQRSGFASASSTCAQRHFVGTVGAGPRRATGRKIGPIF